MKIIYHSTRSPQSFLFDVEIADIKGQPINNLAPYEQFTITKVKSLGAAYSSGKFPTSEQIAEAELAKRGNTFYFDGLISVNSKSYHNVLLNRPT